MFIHTTHDLCTSLLPDVALYLVFYYLLPVKFRALFFQKTPQLIIALLPLSLSLSLNFSFSHSLSHSLPVFRAPPFLLPPPIRSIVSQKPGIARSRSILLDSFVAFSTSQSPTILLNRDIFSLRFRRAIPLRACVAFFHLLFSFSFSPLYFSFIATFPIPLFNLLSIVELFIILLLCTGSKRLIAKRQRRKLAVREEYGREEARKKERKRESGKESSVRIFGSLGSPDQPFPSDEISICVSLRCSKAMQYR